MINKKKKSITHTITQSFLVISFGLLLMGIVIIGVSTYMQINKITEYSNRMIIKEADFLSETFDTISAKMLSFTNHRDFINKLGRPITSQEMLNMDRDLSEIIKVEHSLIEDITVIGKNGYIYSTITKSNLSGKYDYLTQDWVKEAMNVQKKAYLKVSDLHARDYYSSFTINEPKEDTFSITLALQNYKREIVGVLIYNIDLTQLKKRLSTGMIDPQATVCLLKNNGTILVGKESRFSADMLQKFDTRTSGHNISPISGKQYYMDYCSTGMGLVLVSFVPVVVLFEPLIYSMLALLLVVILLTVLCLVINMRISASIRRPVNELTEHIMHVDGNDLSLPDSDYVFDELNQIEDKFQLMIQRLNKMIDKDYKSQILINQFRLYSLRSQVNPHFLMNTLQQLQTEIVCEETERANDIVVALSRMMNYSLYHYESMVPIEQELQYIRSYLDLFILKFDGKLKIEYDLNETLMNYYMPKMILQPVLENCILHGFSENPADSVVTISLKEQNQDVLFVIQDNGKGMSPAQVALLTENMDTAKIDDKNIGIRNIQQRIRLRWGDQYGVTLTSEEGVGTTCYILIPRTNGTDTNDA